jgi:hypothetical protein
VDFCSRWQAVAVPQSRAILAPALQVLATVPQLTELYDNQALCWPVLNASDAPLSRAADARRAAAAAEHDLQGASEGRPSGSAAAAASGSRGVGSASRSPGSKDGRRHLRRLFRTVVAGAISTIPGGQPAEVPPLGELPAALPQALPAALAQALPPWLSERDVLQVSAELASLVSFQVLGALRRLACRRQRPAARAPCNASKQAFFLPCYVCTYMVLAP